MLINIVSRKDFSYSLVEIESTVEIEPNTLNTWSSKPDTRTHYMIKSRACVRKFYISVFVLEILERRKVLKRGCSIS